MKIDLDSIKDDFTRSFFEHTFKMIHQSKMHEDTSITPDNVYQQAYKANRDLLYEIVEKSHLEGSTILGVENLKKLHRLAKEGKSCLILSEHVSNLDVPSMFVRFYDYPDDELKEIFERIIFIAGVKLNENPLVKLYTEMFSRVVIYPIRSLSKMKDKDEHKEQIDMAKKINIRSTRKIGELRKKGNIFVLYPAGTRYRPWNPDTKKGIKELTSYLYSFDYICCSSINGNNMIPEEHEDMTKETYKKDVIVFSFGDVIESKKYINKIIADMKLEQTNDKDKIKQAVIDKVMSDIDQLHNDADIYLKNLEK